MNKKRTLLFSILAVFIASTVIPIFTLSTKVEAIPDEARQLELERRQLHSALVCLDDGVIDTDDDIENFEDMFHERRWAGADKNSSAAEVSVWGLDRNDNGAATCKSAIEQALQALGEDHSELGILSALTEGNRTNFGETFPGNELKYEELRNRFTQERDQRRQEIIDTYGSEVYDFLLRERLFSAEPQPLIDLCFAVEHPDEASRQPDFTVELENGDTANFIYAENSDIHDAASTDNGGWYDDDGAFGRPPRIGDIQLPHDGNDYDPRNDGFYPFGSDRNISDQSFGDNTNTVFGIEVTQGVVSCGMIESNKDFIFGEQFRFNGNSLELVDPVTSDATGAPTSTDQDAADPEEDNSCETKAGVWGWILCSGIRLIDGALHFADSQIARLLEVDETKLSSELEQAWGVLRNIAYTILIPIMLVMVIGTALGFEFVSAYTVKRALPRMAIAIIFIALSWEIANFLIVLTNSLGRGVLGILTSPFGNNVATLSLSEFYGANGISGIFSGITGSAFIIAGVIALIYFFWAPALLIMLIAFGVLMLRQILIVTLVLAAPLAILAWIFPGNDRFWKLWWGSFSKLLLMFPLIMGLLAVGRIFAWTIHNNQAGGLEGAIINPLFILIAYVAPYAFIPYTFKFAGGMLATISGAVNDRSRGIFDRQRQKRAEKFGRMQAGNTIRNAPQGSFRSRFNRGLGYATNINKAGLNPRRAGTRMRTALQERDESGIGELMDSSHFKQWSGDDAKVSAAQFTNREDIANELARFDAGRFAGENNRARRDEAVEQILRSQRGANPDTFQRARVRAMAGTGTGYQYTDSNGVTRVDYSRMIRDINQAYGSDRNGAGQALAQMRSSLAQSGHAAGLAGYGTWAGAMEDMYNGTISAEDAHNRIMDDTINSVGPGQAIYGKPSSAAEIGMAHTRRLQGLAERVGAASRGEVMVPDGQGGQRPLTTREAQADFKEALASSMGLHGAMSQASPQNARALKHELTSQMISDPSSGQSMSVWELGTHSSIVSDAEFLQMRDDFQGRSLREAANAQAHSAAQRAASEAAQRAATGGGAPPSGPTPPQGMS